MGGGKRNLVSSEILSASNTSYIRDFSAQNLFIDDIHFSCLSMNTELKTHAHNISYELQDRICVIILNDVVWYHMILIRFLMI